MNILLIVPILMSKLMGEAPQASGMQALHATGGRSIAGAMALHCNTGKTVAIQTISLSNRLLTRDLLQPDTMHHSSLPVARPLCTTKLVKQQTALYWSGKSIKL